MKWGTRNGPPYPLNSSQMTTEQKKHNKVSSWATDSLRKHHKPMAIDEYKKQRRVIRSRNNANHERYRHYNRKGEAFNDIENKEIKYDSYTDEKRVAKTAAKIIAASAALTVGYCLAKNKVRLPQVNKAVNSVMKKSGFLSPTASTIKNSGKYLSGYNVFSATQKGLKNIGLGASRKSTNLAKLGINKLKEIDPSAAIQAINNMPTNKKITLAYGGASAIGYASLYKARSERLETEALLKKYGLT